MIDFIGSTVFFKCIINIVLALLIFGIEFTFAFAIQAVISLLSNETLIPNSTLNLSIFDINQALIFLLIVGMIRVIILWGQLYNSSIISLLFETLNRKRVIKWSFENRNSELALAANLFSDRSIGAGNFISSLINFSSRSLTLLLIIIALISLSFQVTLASLLFILLLFPIIRFLSKRINLITTIIHQDIDAAVTKLMLGIKNSFFYHMYGKNKQEANICDDKLDNYFTNYKNYHLLNSIKTVTPQFFGIFYICVIAYVSFHYNLIQNEILIAYFYLFIRLMLSIGELGNLFSYIKLTKPRFISVFNWYSKNQKLFLTTKKMDTKIRIFRKPIGITFSQINFKYTGIKKNIFTNFNLCIPARNTLIITGKSGVGKSTIISLITGLENPQSGKIIINENQKSYDLKNCINSFQLSLAYVGPEPFIISGTIKDNLLFGGNKKTISNDYIFKILKLTNCNFIDMSNKGLQKKLSEQGEGLSAGQKQRLALARALLRQPKILLLDEVTANLDKLSSKKLVDSLKLLKNRMTIIAITHKSEMLEIADQHLDLNKK